MHGKSKEKEKELYFELLFMVGDLMHRSTALQQVRIPTSRVASPEMRILARSNTLSFSLASA